MYYILTLIVNDRTYTHNQFFFNDKFNTLSLIQAAQILGKGGFERNIM